MEEVERRGAGVRRRRCDSTVNPRRSRGAPPAPQTQGTRTSTSALVWRCTVKSAARRSSRRSWSAASARPLQRRETREQTSNASTGSKALWCSNNTSAGEGAIALRRCSVRWCFAARSVRGATPVPLHQCLPPCRCPTRRWRGRGAARQVATRDVQRRGGGNFTLRRRVTCTSWPTWPSLPHSSSRPEPRCQQRSQARQQAGRRRRHRRTGWRQAQHDDAVAGRNAGPQRGTNRRNLRGWRPPTRRDSKGAQRWRRARERGRQKCGDALSRASVIISGAIPALHAARQSSRLPR